MSKVMIVDDLKENLSLLDITLSKCGYETRIFGNPMTALKAVEECNPDLILLDINMPQMSGFELCSEIKKNESIKNIPIIFLTAQEDKESKVKAFECGGVDYITKPFIIEELCARVKNHLEISALQRKLENMNIKLEEKVQERTKNLLEELEIRKKVEKKLKSALMEVSEANNAKKIFLANMNHEIRTPINGIVGMTEILRDSTLSEELKSILEYQKEAEDTLMKIVDNLIDMQKYETGNIEIKSESIDLKDIVKTVILKNDITAMKKELKLFSVVDEDFPEKIIADGEKIEEILMQFLNNSLKFTETGEIAVEVKKISETDEFIEIEFSVKDSGKGISENEKEKMFKMFSQGDNSYTKIYKGLGLGLAISKKLTEAMNGEIGYESEEGKGSRFYFKIKGMKF